MRTPTILAVLLTACGGAGPVEDTTPAPEAPSGPVSVTDDANATAVVGPEGGTLSLTGGTVLVIPPGAIREPIEVTVRLDSEGRAFADTAQAPLGPPLSVIPYVPSAGEPFVLSMPERPLPQGYEARDLTLAVEEEDQQRGFDARNTRDPLAVPLGADPRWALRGRARGALRPSHAVRRLSVSAASFARTDDEDVAAALGVSLEAVQLARASEVIDLHLESWLQPRLFGTKLETRQTGSWLGRHFFGHLDYPRALDGGLTAAMWSIATNVLKPKRSRFRALLQNVENHRASLEATGAIRVVTTHAEFLAARAGWPARGAPRGAGRQRLRGRAGRPGQRAGWPGHARHAHAPDRQRLRPHLEPARLRPEGPPRRRQGSSSSS